MNPVKKMQELIDTIKNHQSNGGGSEPEKSTYETLKGIIQKHTYSPAAWCVSGIDAAAYHCMKQLDLHSKQMAIAFLDFREKRCTNVGEGYIIDNWADRKQHSEEQLYDAFLQHIATNPDQYPAILKLNYSTANEKQS